MAKKEQKRLIQLQTALTALILLTLTSTVHTTIHCKEGYRPPKTARRA